MYFAIHVQGGKEKTIIEVINNKLDKTHFDEVFSPVRESIRKKDGKEYTISEVLFPGYIFVSTNNPKAFAAELFYIPQYARMLGRDESSGDYLPLSEEEVVMMDTLCGKEVDRTLKASLIQLEEGKKVKVVYGQLQGLEGYIYKVDLHKRICTLRISILGNKLDLNVPISYVKKQSD